MKDLIVLKEIKETWIRTKGKKKGKNKERETEGKAGRGRKKRMSGYEWKEEQQRGRFPKGWRLCPTDTRTGPDYPDLDVLLVLTDFCPLVHKVLHLTKLNAPAMGRERTPSLNASFAG